jgi:hypothetical protein
MLGLCDNCGEYDELERDPATLEWLCENCEEAEEEEESEEEE